MPSGQFSNNFSSKAKEFSETVFCPASSNLVSRSNPSALITNPEEAKKHVLNMVENQALNCLSGKKIPCQIDSVCIHLSLIHI